MNNKLVTTTIVEELGRNGAHTLDDLYTAIHKLHSEMERSFFEETLMVMEIQGLIRVYKMARGKRRVELAKG